MLDRVLAGGLIVIVSLTSDLLKGVSPTERGLLAVNVAKRGFSERYEKKFKFRLKVNICRTDNRVFFCSSTTKSEIGFLLYFTTTMPVYMI